MVKRSARFFIISAVLGGIALLSLYSIKQNHHRVAISYLEKEFRYNILKVLYPQHHYTKANITESPLYDALFEQHTSLVKQHYSNYEEMGEEVNYHRENATFFSLVRNEELYLMLQSIKQVEDRFNRRYHYDWIFANDEDFTELFKSEVGSLVSGNATFVKIPVEYWSYPEWIDQEKAAKTRRKMKLNQIIYGGSESYRHMCRFNSGFFHRLEAFNGIKYYWRVEPDIRFNCDLPYDYFRYMRENDIKYGWTMSLHEIKETIDGLFDATLEFFNKNPSYIAQNNDINFISIDSGNTYNLCHYWSNFEIGDLDFLRSDRYREYFEHLDKKGGFFYERWGDAPVHSLAVSYLLNQNEIHYFDNTGYSHMPHSQCPRDIETRTHLRCACQPAMDFNRGHRDSCLARFLQVRKPKN